LHFSHLNLPELTCQQILKDHAAEALGRALLILSEHECVEDTTRVALWFEKLIYMYIYRIEAIASSGSDH
jgi:hypothetical protein